MKKIGQTKSIIGIVGFAILFALLTVLSFVPMQFGSKNYNSFFGSIPTTNDLNDGITAIYNIEGEPTASEIDSATVFIKKLLADNGYVGASANRLGDNQIRVEIGKPASCDNIAVAENFLKSNISTGQLIISDASSFDDVTAAETAIANGEETTVSILYATKHFENISIQSYEAYYAVMVDFNDAGLDIFASLSSNAKTVYFYVDGEAFPSSSNNSVELSTSSTTQLSLWFEEYEAAENYKNYFLAGMMPINLDSDTIEVFSQDKTSKIGYIDSSVAMLILCLVAVVLCLVYLAIKYKTLGFISGFSFCLILFVSLFIFQALPWFTMSLGAYVTALASIVFVFSGNVIFYNKISNEYALGKSLETSIDTAYKKSIPSIVESSSLFAISGLIIGFVGQGVFASIATILVVAGLMNVVSSLGLVRLFMSFYYGLNEEKAKSVTTKKEAE